MTYVTHPTPPAGDDSQKIATTAWVRGITDALSGGMYPKIQNATWSSDKIYAPSGGTWWVYAYRSSPNDNSANRSYSGGAQIGIGGSDVLKYKYLCIKIA